MMTSANSSDSKLYIFVVYGSCHIGCFPVMFDTKLRDGSMLSRFFVHEQSTQIICTSHTPTLKGHQQGPSTSQSGPYLRDGAEKIRWIFPLPL